MDKVLRSPWRGKLRRPERTTTNRRHIRRDDMINHIFAGLVFVGTVAFIWAAAFYGGTR